MKTSVKKNLFYNSIYQIVIMILPLITAPYISRIIGAKGLGIYSYNFSISLYFVYFCMLGILNYGNRAISKSENDRKKLSKTFSSIYYMQLITSLLFFIFYIIYSLFFVKNNQNIALLLSLHVISAMFDVSWFYFGMQEFKITTIRQLIIRLLTFFSIFIFVKDKNDLWVYTLIMSLGYFASGFSLWIMLWKKVELVKVSVSSVAKHIVPSIILFIPIIATSIYRLMDKVMIGKFSGMEQVGYYESAEKLIMVSLGVIGSFATVIMPKISNLLYIKEQNKATKLFNMSMEFSLFIGMAICFGIASISNEFIPLFFGNEFKPSIVLSILLSLSVPFITWSTIIRNLFLIPNEMDGIYVKSVVYGAIINAFLNLLLIPRYDALGAVFATIVAEITLALHQTIRIYKKINLKLFLKYFFIFGLFGFFMFLIVRLNRKYIDCNIVGLIAEIVIGFCFYMIVSIIYFYISKNEVFLNVLKKIRK